jgi:hypothetical protein
MVHPSYLTEIHGAKTSLALRTNSGTGISTKQGNLSSHLFWLDINGLANVISLRTLEKLYPVLYDSTKRDGAFVVDTTQGEIVFQQCPLTGFQCIDLNNHTEDGRAMLVQTVWENLESYSTQQIERASKTRKIQNKLGHPSEEEFKRVLRDKDNVSRTLLKDCHITPEDIANAHVIFGLSLPRVKGVTMMRKPRRVELHYVKLLMEIIEMNKHVTIVADVMFVCGLPL